MGRGVSSGGGQSSLGYLFGDGEGPKPSPQAAPAPASADGQTVNNGRSSKPAVVDASKQIPAGINSTSSNNYLRADGQNTGNFITDRPSTKVHSAPVVDPHWSISLAVEVTELCLSMFNEITFCCFLWNLILDEVLLS